MELGIAVRPGEFKHGLRCARCSAPITRYTKRPLGVIPWCSEGDGCEVRLVSELVCVPCGIGGNARDQKERVGLGNPRLLIAGALLFLSVAGCYARQWWTLRNENAFRGERDGVA